MQDTFFDARTNVSRSSEGRAILAIQNFCARKTPSYFPVMPSIFASAVFTEFAEVFSILFGMPVVFLDKKLPTDFEPLRRRFFRERSQFASVFDPLRDFFRCGAGQRAVCFQPFIIRLEKISRV